MSLEAKLRHIERVKSFGEDLGLDFKGCLSRYDSSTKNANIYTLWVLPPNSLVPYMEKDEVAKSNRKLKRIENSYRKKGHDTCLEESITWAQGQITNSLLEEDYLSLVGVVLHEGWHNTTQIDDFNFDEAIATAVECYGPIEYCKLYRHKEIEKSRGIHSDIKKIAKFIVKYHDHLSKAYEQPNWTELKSVITKEACTEHSELMRELVAYPKDFINVYKMNNAYFYKRYVYYQHFKLVDKLFGKIGLEEGIKFFKRYKGHKNCIKEILQVTCGR